MNKNMGCGTIMLICFGVLLVLKITNIVALTWLQVFIPVVAYIIIALVLFIVVLLLLFCLLILTYLSEVGKK